MRPNDALVAASFFITQVQSVVSRNVNPIEGGGDLWLFQAGVARIMSSQIQPFTWYHSRDSGHDLLVQKEVKTQSQKGVAAAFGMEVESELKQAAYLLRTNPALARELMDFFEEKTRSS